MEGKEEKHSVNWVANQIDNLSKLWKESKPKFFSVLGYYAIIFISLLLNAIYLPYLNGQIAKLKNDKTDLEKSNTNLEIRLAPFRAVALEKFSGSSENEALSALAERIGQVELQVISLFDYQEVSTWTFLGGTVRQLGGGASTIGNSPAT
jgi:hypothetical protein